MKKYLVFFSLVLACRPREPVFIGDEWDIYPSGPGRFTLVVSRANSSAAEVMAIAKNGTYQTCLRKGFQDYDILDQSGNKDNTWAVGGYSGGFSGRSKNKHDFVITFECKNPSYAPNINLQCYKSDQCPMNQICDNKGQCIFEQATVKSINPLKRIEIVPPCNKLGGNKCDN